MPDFVQKTFDYLYANFADRIHKDPNVDWMFFFDDIRMPRRELVHRLTRLAAIDKVFVANTVINQWVTLKYRTSCEEPGNHSTYSYEDEPEIDPNEDPSETRSFTFDNFLGL